MFTPNVHDVKHLPKFIQSIREMNLTVKQGTQTIDKRDQKIKDLNREVAKFEKLIEEATKNLGF